MEGSKGLARLAEEFPDQALRHVLPPLAVAPDLAAHVSSPRELSDDPERVAVEKGVEVAQQTGRARRRCKNSDLRVVGAGVRAPFACAASGAHLFSARARL
jgi:hypothetical protein